MTARSQGRSERISGRMTLGAAELEIADLARSVAFYEDVVGLSTLERGAGRATLGGQGGAPVLRLVEKAGAAPKPRAASGLFHLAFLLPERTDLAAAFERTRRLGVLTGASDHLVSEAIYLDDPDGLGVEIYRDRPQAEWPREDGRLRMASDPIDAAGLMSLAGKAGVEGSRAPGGTQLGHVHLQVGDLAQAESFWIDGVGLDVTARMQGAAFMSAGGYHHHVAANVWSSRGRPGAPEGVARLACFEIVLPSEEDVEETAERLMRAGVQVERRDRAAFASDPWGSGILIHAV